MTGVIIGCDISSSCEGFGEIARETGLDRIEFRPVGVDNEDPASGGGRGEMARDDDGREEVRDDFEDGRERLCWFLTAVVGVRSGFVRFDRLPSRGGVSGIALLMDEGDVPLRFN